MNTGKNRKAQGVVMTLTGGILWGLCGSCGQFLFQYKEATSNWLVPIRLMGAGILILFLSSHGGPKWTRTIDLTIISRVL